MNNLIIEHAEENDGRRTKTFALSVAVDHDHVHISGYIGDCYGKKQSMKHLRIETIDGSPELRDIVTPLAFLMRYEERVIEMIEKHIEDNDGE